MGKRSPGSGERTARKGLRYQDRASAILAYEALVEGTLSFIALADDHAGMFDDLVIGIAGKVIGHQYKSSSKPKPLGVRGLLLGTGNVIADCAFSFMKLESEFPGKFVRVRYVTSHIASVGDKGQFGVKEQDSADFFREKARHPDRSLTEWSAGIWQPIIAELLQASGLSEKDFERFFSRLDIVFGAASTIDFNPALDAATKSQITELARAIGDLVGRDDGKTRWSRRELLDELGWPDRFQQRFEHRFPLGAHVQSNEKSEAELEKALVTCSSGYLCLLGPPGAGKSTLLERFVRPGPGLNVVRYLAFVPGAAQQQGRGEAANFLADLNSQLIGLGLQTGRAKDDTSEQRRETFEKLLAQATKRYSLDGELTIIVVDGLDHVPREEKPEATFLSALPLPQSVPEGVICILGSQRIDLADIPREVRDQASLDGRRIDIAPLTEAVVGDMIASVGLKDAVDPAEVFSVSLGHPLVTQYLLGKLQNAEEQERRALLTGGFEYDGDLEKVYRAAWREAEEADVEVSKVLFTLSFAEGRIEPELLAQCLSREAVNNAYKIAHHLIDHAGRGWQVFHNSFRLFLRQQKIELYGRPDPDFSESSLYRRLAELSKSASADSTQRWLEFRYRFLAGDRAEAAAIANRTYFIRQFIDGRRSYEVSNDIRDAFACLKPGHRAEQLFDLMLAKDEILRRRDALTTAQNLVAAQIAAGDLAIAEAQLDESHSAGDEWLVIQALLDDGQPDRARILFDDENPWKWFDDGYRSGKEDLLKTWADYAVVLLDDEQIERRIRRPEGKDEDKESFYGYTPRSYFAKLRFALARSILRHDPKSSVAAVSLQHGIDENNWALLHLESAEAKLAISQAAKARDCLIAYEACNEVEALHGSWHVHAARLALASGDPQLATRLFAKASIPNLCNLEHRSDDVEDAVRYLVEFCTLTARLGKPNPKPELPSEFLFRGIQNHAVRLGAMIGGLRAAHCLQPSAISKQIKDSLNFIAGAVPGRTDDVLLEYRVRHADKPLFDAICEIVRLAPDSAPDFEVEFEACLKLPVCAFRASLAILRKFTETMFEFDGDAGSALARLEAARSDVDQSRSPHEAIDQLSELSIAFGKIGFSTRAKELLHEMREMSLGAYLAAKKDGQYHLWADVLVAANQADPTRASERSFMMLRLIAGVDNSDAHDQAWRISKTVLVEATSCGAAQAWDAFDWAKSSGIWNWDGLVDAVARGILRRRPDLAIPLAIAWTNLCAPYYNEGYNSITRTGQFLRDLASASSADDLFEIERIIVVGIETGAKPSQRPRLLQVFRDALADRAVISSRVSDAVARWNAEPAYDDDALPDYFGLKSFEDIGSAVAVERERREAQTSTHYGDFVNSRLGKRIARILAEQPWCAVEQFAAKNPKLVNDRPVKIAVALAAVAAGRGDYAETLLFAGTEGGEGWGGWSDRRLLEYHKARHLLELENAHEKARNDFVRDLSAGGHGTGSALWGLEEILPLLYQDIDWPALWDRLADQIESYRDYQKIPPVPLGNGASHDDVDLLARLFVDAANLGVTDPREQATEGLLDLSRAKASEPFIRACGALLDGDAPETLLGARILFEAREGEGVADAFKNRMYDLVEHEDACVAAIGEILSDVWGGTAQISGAKLPAIYSLEIPPMDKTEGRSLRDEESLGPVIDDPAAWTEGFESWVDSISDFSGVPISNIRRPVAQLISGWGGVAAYGAKAAELLRREVEPLGLLLPFVRPHIGICLRALHVVIGEFWRASKLTEMQVDLLLHRLAGAPVLPPHSVYSSRPIDLKWPALPRDTWRVEADDWLGADDFMRDNETDNVIGEWGRLVVCESGASYEEEMLAARRMPKTDAENVDRAIAALPKAYWGCGTIMLGDEARDVSIGLRNLQISLVGKRAVVLMFDPVLAYRLGWHQTQKDPFSFCHPKHGLMATTRFWRDGWPQPSRHANTGRWAEGQRVELTEAGLAEIDRLCALPQLVTVRWRVLKSRSSKPKRSSRWRSDGSLLLS